MSRIEIIGGKAVNVYEMMQKPDVAKGVAEVERRQNARAQSTGKDCTLHMTAKYIREVANLGDHGSFEELWAAFDMDYNG